MPSSRGCLHANTIVFDVICLRLWWNQKRGSFEIFVVMPQISILRQRVFKICTDYKKFNAQGIILLSVIIIIFSLLWNIFLAKMKWSLQFIYFSPSKLFLAQCECIFCGSTMTNFNLTCFHASHILFYDVKYQLRLDHKLLFVYT